MAQTTPKNIALYQKYRPTSFDDVRGQDHVISVLRAALSGEKIAHAYLFSGSRGTGKTSVARILARELGIVDEDLYEIDAASNRQVADIDDLRESVRTLPFGSPYKMYILDEVHMLSTHAFNALLKTLEEPPKHVIFVLATTEEHKLPETIISRCQVFEFKKPNRALLADLATDIADREGVTLGDGVPELIALLGNGSFRDTHGILQKVITLSADATISREEVERVTGAPSLSIIESVLRGVAGSDMDMTLSALTEAAEANIDPTTLAARIMDAVRLVLLVRFAPGLHATLRSDVGDDMFDIAQSLAGKEGAAINAGLLTRLIDASRSIGTSPVPMASLEVAFMEHLAK